MKPVMIWILGAEADLALVPLQSILDATQLVAHAIHAYTVQNQEPGNLGQHTSSLPAT